MAININLKIEKKHLYLLSAIMVFLVGVGYVIAVNPASKPNPGHDSTELMINIGGADKTLQSAIDAGDFGGGGVISYIKVSDTVASGVGPQPNAHRAWTKRRINTVDSDSGGYVSIANDQITLAPGTYVAKISSPVRYNSLNHKARFRNVDADITVIVGTSEQQHDDYSRGTARSFISGEFTITQSTTFEIQHYKQSGYWGIANNLGEPEVYTVAEFFKIG